MAEPAIRSVDLAKSYRLGARREPYQTLRQGITDLASAPFRWLRGDARDDREFWALKDVSFDVMPGDLVGIVGRNGAGKSTLLRLLSRITEPTSGRAEIRGRVGSLLEVGTGFHPELTGRENIFLTGSILGMARAEVRRKFDQIVDFAGNESFLDTPVKYYSSGMYTRLGFAVAAHLETDILFVDEVLAVGDLSFQRKCLGKMRGVGEQGRTVLFVSHNLSAVWSLCRTCMWFDGGMLREYGPVGEVLDHYRQAMTAADTDLALRVLHPKATGHVRVTGLYIRDVGGVRRDTVCTGDPTEFVVEYEAKQPTIDDVEILVVIVNEFEMPLFSLTTRVAGTSGALPGRGRIVFAVARLPLSAGDYSLHFYCHVRGGLADKEVFAARFSVAEGDFFGSGILPDRRQGNVLVDQRWYAEELRSEPDVDPRVVQSPAAAR